MGTLEKAEGLVHFLPSEHWALDISSPTFCSHALQTGQALQGFRRKEETGQEKYDRSRSIRGTAVLWAQV
jgi:hypothetical protein